MAVYANSENRSGIGGVERLRSAKRCHLQQCSIPSYVVSWGESGNWLIMIQFNVSASTEMNLNIGNESFIQEAIEHLQSRYLHYL